MGRCFSAVVKKVDLSNKTAVIDNSKRWTARVDNAGTPVRHAVGMDTNQKQ